MNEKINDAYAIRDVLTRTAVNSNSLAEKLKDHGCNK